MSTFVKDLAAALAVLTGSALALGMGWALSDYYYTKITCASLPFLALDYSRSGTLLCLQAKCNSLTPRRFPC